jgi:membrane protein YdbS with pleckstrin-like domain
VDNFYLNQKSHIESVAHYIKSMIMQKKADSLNLVLLLVVGSVTSMYYLEKTSIYYYPALIFLIISMFSSIFLAYRLFKKS